MKSDEKWPHPSVKATELSPFSKNAPKFAKYDIMIFGFDPRHIMDKIYQEDVGNG